MEAIPVRNVFQGTAVDVNLWKQCDIKSALCSDACGSGYVNDSPTGSRLSQKKSVLGLVKQSKDLNNNPFCLT